MCLDRQGENCPHKVLAKAEHVNLNNQTFRQTHWDQHLGCMEKSINTHLALNCNPPLTTSAATSVHKFHISTVSADCKGWISTVWTCKEGKAKQQHQTDILHYSSCLSRALNAGHAPFTLHERFGFSYLSQSYCQVICFKFHILDAKAASCLPLNIILFSKNVIQIGFFK